MEDGIPRLNFKPTIDPQLIEPHSWVKASVPILPIPFAMIGFTLNVFIPGSGTILSGLLILLHVGRPRFSEDVTCESRFGAFFINFVVGMLQLVTVLLCLVGFCWSLGWGLTLIFLARRNKEFLEEQRTDKDNQRILSQPRQSSSISLSLTRGCKVDIENNLIATLDNAGRTTDAIATESQSSGSVNGSAASTPNNVDRID